MAIVLLRRRTMHAFTCVLLLLLLQKKTFVASVEINQAHDEHLERNHENENVGISQNESQNVQRRQDNGFDFMSYFMGKNSQQQQQQAASQQHSQQLEQQPSQIQQQHLLQQQLLQQQQQRQQEQLQQLQQQQLIQLQQHPRTPDVGYQDNTIHQQYQPQTVALNREGYNGGLGIGTGYQQGYAQEPKAIDISVGGGKPVIKVGNILTLLPRIINVLSAGGKVMFGVELGNNFYFGPVGAKPLHKLA